MHGRARFARAHQPQALFWRMAPVSAACGDNQQHENTEFKKPDTPLRSHPEWASACCELAHPLLFSAAIMRRLA